MLKELKVESELKDMSVFSLKEFLKKEYKKEEEGGNNSEKKKKKTIPSTKSALMVDILALLEAKKQNLNTPN